MTERRRIRAIREHTGDRANAAHHPGEHTTIERNGRSFAVLVPYAWRAERQHREGQEGRGTLVP
ncbi:hypothetical protein ACGFIV_03835 [Sphaerisporangium sp. NPDC049003]|uniref:hypothetical protein n=1 Tax=Sphaerisporangium sp. NPDC049003 TaxID=3364517 RepID=UPI0037108689